MKHTITREIGIDMGHRVTYHASKCKNLHGHRYTIQAVCEGPLAEGGEQDGMVVDFGFLKSLMMDEIDAPCDHGMCLWVHDPLTSVFLGPLYGTVAKEVRLNGVAFTEANIGKLVVLDVVPTAENLARVWFGWLKDGVTQLSQGRARLLSVKVWETPNCMAEYSPTVMTQDDEYRRRMLTGGALGG